MSKDFIDFVSHNGTHLRNVWNVYKEQYLFFCLFDEKEILEEMDFYCCNFKKNSQKSQKYFVNF